MIEEHFSWGLRQNPLCLDILSPEKLEGAYFNVYGMYDCQVEPQPPILAWHGGKCQPLPALF